MNINIQSGYDSSEAHQIRLLADKTKNREVDTNIATNSHYIASEAKRQEQAEFQEKILQATTMDVNEVKDFLFMLIGAEVKVKPETDNSGSLVDRLV